MRGRVWRAVCGLRHQNLALLGLTRQTMIDTDATAYAETVQWAAAVHRSFPDIDGTVWTSRQHDSARAYVFFGDRVGNTDLVVHSPTVPIDAGPGRAELAAFARAYRIDLIPSS